MNKLEWSRIDRLSKKQKVINILGGRCLYCGEINFYKLCIHHVKDNKSEDFSNLIKKRWSLIENEIKNCILLCKNDHNKLHYDLNSNQDKKGKKLFLEYKGTNECMICGYKDSIASLEFHHRNPIEKKLSIHKCYGGYMSLENIRKEFEDELNKCDVLCSNCHAELHLNDGFYDLHKEEIIKKSKNMKETMLKVDRNIILKLFNEGNRQIDIANKLNINRQLVSYIFKELNLPKKPA